MVGLTAVFRLIGIFGVIILKYSGLTYISIGLITFGIIETVGLPLKYLFWKYYNIDKAKFGKPITLTCEPDKLHYSGLTNKGSND